MNQSFPFPKNRWVRALAGASVSTVLALSSPLAHANDDIAAKTLTDQARFWEGKGRSDLAAAAWRRLLKIDPKNPEALAGLAQFEIDSNRPEAARAIVEELKAQPQANREAIRRIENAATQRTLNTNLLDQARAASRAGKTEEAVALYRQLLEGRNLSGPIALEYYQTLGGTTNGWDEARKGFERQLAEDPSNQRAALSYGQHLTYRAATRREGIRILADLARKPGVSAPAVEAWRKALIWLEASKSDLSLFQAYLGVQPNDAAIQARIASLNQAFTPKPLDARSIALRDGFSALNVGDVGEAETRFEALLASGPKNPDALGGLGVVRLKQERFGDAEKLLAEAIRLSGNRKWDEALTSARFWLALDEGDSAAESGDIVGARRHYMRAAQLDPRNARPPAALADLLAQEGRLADAERAYRSVLTAHPKSVDVRRGLAGVLVRQGKIDEALVLADGLTDAEKEDLGYGSLKAEQYRRAGVQMIARGDPVGAMQQLEEALLWDPNSPWLRLELARLYHRSGAASEAFGLMDGLLQTRPDMPDALHAAALMSAEAKEYALALAMLEKIPSKSRTREMAELQRQLWVRAQTDKAALLAKMGQTRSAIQVLEQALPAAGRDADLLAGIANVMLDLGDEARSLTMMRTLLAQSPKPDQNLMVQYAGLLLKSRQDVELAAQLRQLYAQPLTPAQRKDVDDIRWVYSVRQTDAQREAGNFSAAYEIAAQLLSERPNDIPAQQALARLYTSAGEHARALSWYHQILQMTEPDVPTLVAAGGAALAAGELQYAQSALDAAARIAPSDPGVLSTQGRLARAQGKPKLAVELLQQAQQVSLAQAQLERSGPLGVNLVDYSMPASGVPNARTGGTVSGVPPIPNPLGGRAVAPASVPQVRPLMQPVGQPMPARPYSQAPETPQPVQPVTQPVWSGGRSSPTQSVSSFTDAPPPREGMRPVQFQLPPGYAERGSSDYRATQPVDTYPAAAGRAAQPAPVSVFAPPQAVTPAGPVLSPVSNFPRSSLQPINAGPGAMYPMAAPATVPEVPRNAPSPYFQPLQTPPVQFVQGGGAAEAAADPRASWDAPTPVSTNPRRVSGPGSLQREIDELRADRAGSVSAGGMWRGRSGESGTSELNDFSTVIEGRFPFGQGGHLVLRMEPVFLSAGRVSGTDLNASQQFGSNALAIVGGGVGTTREQQDSGMALSVGYETARLKLDLGSTPLGFQVTNVVGGVAYNDSFGDVKLKLDLSRRPVTDSLLSYAGTVDDVTGRTWGGVTATGGRLEMGVEQGKFGFFGYGGVHALRGKNVVNNSRFEVGGGAYYKLIQDADMEFTAGVSVTALGYKRNLRYFTLGHGGYFSPQRYFSIALPLELAGKSGRVAYRVDGSIGIQSFRENSAAYFPGDATQQANWETVAAANSVAAPSGVTWRSFYPSQSKTGLGFRLGGEAEYQFAPQWVVGGRVSIDNASDYTQTSGMVYMRYSFDPIYAPTKFPPKVLKVGQ
ncbi:MAG: cellulose synthase [Polaromonas sp.]|nr:cellulose synthase [Polaromonas sp.]